MKKLRNLKLSSLTHFEAGQLIKSNLADVSTAGINQNTDPLIRNYLTTLTADSAQMDLALKEVEEQQETDDLELLDMNRDESVVVARMQLKIHGRSKNAAEKAAFNTLRIPFNTYKNIEKLNYVAESNAIDNFVAELEKPVYAAAVTTLNFGGMITRMKNDNTAFKTVFSARSTNVAASVDYDAKAIRKNMMANYAAYVAYVTSLTNATANLANNAYYLSLFNIIDNNRKYYSDMLARKGGNKDNDDPTPDQP
jgi:hypothetical protein